MEIPRVQINTASVDEISNLYDIGQRRAQLIVDYRNAHGPFHGPADLTNVKELTPKLAYTLSPHIDWRLPEEPEPPKQRSWSDTFLWLSILICLLPVILLLSILVVNAIWQGDAIELPQIIAAAGGVGVLLCFSIFATFRMSVALTRQRERARRLARVALASMALALFVGIPLLFGSAFYWWYSSGAAHDVILSGQLFSPSAVGLFALLLLYLFMIPQIIVWRRPQLAESRWLAGIFDFAFALAGLMLTLAVRIQVKGWPLWFLLLAALAGGVVIVVSLLAIRRGESFFHATLDFLDMRRHTQAAATLDTWKYWVSISLPNPAQQRLVQTALNEMHRPTPGQTFSKTVILGIGWWFLITALEAIVQSYVQIYWTDWFG